jgi:serine/threonine-protein kinase RsbW
MQSVLRERMPATARSVRYLRGEVIRFVRAQCPELGKRPLDDVALAVTEAVTNVVVHAYPSGEGPVDVEAWVAEEMLFVEVADEGVGLEDVSRNAGLGMGRRLMSRLAEARVLSRPGGGTRVSLAFPCRAR